MSIDRYDMYEDEGGCLAHYTCKDGDWCKYDDVVSTLESSHVEILELQLKNERLKSELASINDSIREEQEWYGYL